MDPNTESNNYKYRSASNLNSNASVSTKNNSVFSVLTNGTSRDYSDRNRNSNTQSNNRSPKKNYDNMTSTNYSINDFNNGSNRNYSDTRSDRNVSDVYTESTVGSNNRTPIRSVDFDSLFSDDDEIYTISDKPNTEKFTSNSDRSTRKREYSHTNSNTNSINSISKNNEKSPRDTMSGGSCGLRYVTNNSSSGSDKYSDGLDRKSNSQTNERSVSQTNERSVSQRNKSNNSFSSNTISKNEISGSMTGGSYDTDVMAVANITYSDDKIMKRLDDVEKRTTKMMRGGADSDLSVSWSNNSSANSSSNRSNRSNNSNRSAKSNSLSNSNKSSSSNRSSNSNKSIRSNDRFGSETSDYYPTESDRFYGSETSQMETDSKEANSENDLFDQDGGYSENSILSNNSQKKSVSNNKSNSQSNSNNRSTTNTNKSASNTNRSASNTNRSASNINRSISNTNMDNRSDNYSDIFTA